MELYQSQDNKGEVPKLATPISLADCSQSDYHEAESRFLKQLTLLAKRQFSQVSDLVCVLLYTCNTQRMDREDRGDHRASTLGPFIDDVSCIQIKKTRQTTLDSWLFSSQLSCIIMFIPLFVSHLGFI